MKSHIGRPKVENPKNREVKARIDRDMMERVMRYCNENGKTITDVVREGIDLIIGEKK